MSIKVSGGGGAPAPVVAAPGANIETFGTFPDAGAVLTLDLDPDGNATILWLNGMALNNTKDGLVVETKGRYSVFVTTPVNVLATAWYDAVLFIATTPFLGTVADATRMPIPPTSVMGHASVPTISYFTYVELDIGGLIQFQARQFQAPNGSALPLVDAYCQVQYVGKATSL